MATENQQTAPEENTSEVPSDDEVFAGEPPVKSELSEQEVFAGPAGAPAVPAGHKRFSTIQKVLVASIVVIAAVLLYALLESRSGPVTSRAITPAVQQTPSPKPPVKVPQQIQKPEPVLTPAQPLSLRVAQNFYLTSDYSKAYAVYSQLYQSLPTGAEDELVRDFIQLKMALCMEKAGDIEQASRLFRAVSKSRSPAVKAIANYHRALAEMQKKQYLTARTRAYQAIALIGAVDYDRDWALAFERDCHFLAAECLTRNILSLCDADKDLPGELWSGSAEADPFTGLNEAQLRSFLNSGSEQLSKGLLGPQIQKLERTGATPRFSVICRGASIEELLARFSVNAGFDVRWDSRYDIRKRPVSLYLPAVTTQQFATVAAGCAGLLARVDEKRVVNIFNPENYSSLSEHISLLSEEAVSLWQRFLLTFHDDERIPNAHFVLGLLQTQRGRLAEAIAEYKLVVNRYSTKRASLAPFALLYSSRLKSKLRDYPGARQDLVRLVEQYPDTEIAGQAYLELADATMKAGLETEAGRVYRKVYNISLSVESQTAAALGAGRCFYVKKDYEAAAKWLTRYINLAKGRTSDGLYSAYFLLGKALAAPGKLEAACDAFQSALAGGQTQLSREEYVETVSALVKGYMRQEHFIEALDVLENVRSGTLRPVESIEILLLKSKILRAMGLVDKAIAALGDRAEYVSDPQLKAKMSFELTNCHIAKGNLELACRNLTEILVLVEPGPLAHEVACELADVCLKLGQNTQTISVCLQLLDSGPSEQIKQKALVLLATAYIRQKDYDRAVLALLGQWDGHKAPNEGITFDSPSITDQLLRRDQ